MARTARIELRAEPEREEQIREAARLSNQSVSSFVLDAASERAEQVLRAATTTTVPADYFDELHRALDEPPTPDPALQRVARRSRRVVQALSHLAFTSEALREHHDRTVFDSGNIDLDR